MTSIKFREPYSQEELETLYPPHLKLQLVQVVRHPASPAIRELSLRSELTMISRIVYATWYIALRN